MQPPGYKYADVTEKIIGSAMRVHQKMRNGYQEKIYQACLGIECRKSGLSFSEETELPVVYDGVEEGRRRVDFRLR